MEYYKKTQQYDDLMEKVDIQSRDFKELSEKIEEV